MEKLVTVMDSNFEADLAIPKSYLMDNGIYCVIMGSYLTMMPVKELSRLQVRDEDYDEAVRLLREGGFIDK